MELDAGVGIDWLPRLLASRAGPLHSPSQDGGVHSGDVAALPGLDHPRCARTVEAGGVIEDLRVATLRFDHGEEDAQARSVGESRFCECVTGLRRLRFAAQVNHPGCQL